MTGMTASPPAAGPAAPPPGDWRALGPADLDAVHDLHRRATDHLGRPDLVRPETRAFFAALLDGGGHLFGLEDGEGLVAYGVLQVTLPPEEDLRALLGLAPDAPFAKLAGAAVRPDAWGRGLHETAIRVRLARATELGLTHLYATAAPANGRSWSNLIDGGLVIAALVEQYGGRLRFIHYRDLGSPLPEAEPATGQWCDAEAIDRQRAALAAGRGGIAWRRTAEGRREILYGGPS
jgi:hypothetical protein